MGFWIFMVVMNLPIPFTMIGLGKYFSKNPPKEINKMFGYRTSMSMKNRAAWKIAHHYCGKLWYQWGWWLLPLSIIPMFFVLGKDEDTVGTMGGVICMIQMIPLLGVILFTERALKKTFDEKKRYWVTEGHESNYPDPIQLKKGDEVTLGEKSEDNGPWPDWIFCTSHRTRKSGWTPVQLLQIEGTKGIAKSDYNAKEMTVTIGETLYGDNRLNGWLWCIRESDGECGWVPENCLELRK